MFQFTAQKKHLLIIENTQYQYNPVLGPYQALATCFGIKRNGYFNGDPVLTMAHALADRLPEMKAKLFKESFAAYSTDMQKSSSKKWQLSSDCELTDDMRKYKHFPV